MLGVVPSDAGGELRQGNDEVGSSSRTCEVSQEEARSKETATEEEKRASKSPYLDRQATFEDSKEITLKGVAMPTLRRPLRPGEIRASRMPSRFRANSARRGPLDALPPSDP